MVVNSLRHAPSRGVSPTNREFHLLLYEEVNHKKWRPVQVLLPEVIVWSFVLRLEHLVVRITPKIKHSVRFQQEGAIE